MTCRRCRQPAVCPEGISPADSSPARVAPARRPTRYGRSPGRQPTDLDRRRPGEPLAGSAASSSPGRRGGLAGPAGAGVGARPLAGFAFGSVTFISAQGDPHAPKRGLTPHSTPHSVPPKPSHAPWGARGAPAEEIDRVMGGSFLCVTLGLGSRCTGSRRGAPLGPVLLRVPPVRVSPCPVCPAGFGLLFSKKN